MGTVVPAGGNRRSQGSFGAETRWHPRRCKDTQAVVRGSTSPGLGSETWDDYTLKALGKTAKLVLLFAKATTAPRGQEALRGVCEDANAAKRVLHASIPGIVKCSPLAHSRKERPGSGRAPPGAGSAGVCPSCARPRWFRGLALSASRRLPLQPPPPLRKARRLPPPPRLLRPLQLLTAVKPRPIPRSVLFGSLRRDESAPG